MDESRRRRRAATPRPTQVQKDETLVTSTLGCAPRGKGKKAAPLVLDGEDLRLVSVEIDGVALAADAYEVGEETLTIAAPPKKPFTLKTVVAIEPEKNTQLSGLYASSGNLCTQCEAEGFRRITYFYDRPDCMASFTSRVEADKDAFPVLLSNGNEVDRGDAAGGRHWARFEDPFKKPGYLFALVAGDLHGISGSFTTKSGRDVKLYVWSEKENADQLDWSLESLKKSMKWDEDVFGLEYDLDVFHIVAVADFNMGAMENKGLNVFNTACVLASPSTATDGDYDRVLGVVAHEYFHNWTGNRVTCRDWFQLTLKEGLTVYRDIRFTSDASNETVKRIQDVKTMRQMQFPEDDGPMAHPIRPEACERTFCLPLLAATRQRPHCIALDPFLYLAPACPACIASQTSRWTTSTLAQSIGRVQRSSACMRPSSGARASERAWTCTSSGTMAMP